MDAIAATALSALKHQEDATQAWSMFYLPASGPCKWVCMTRSHDSTPVKVRFGQLQELRSVARYWYDADKGPKHAKAGMAAKMQLLTLEELKQRTGALPSYGVVEMMAQMGCLAWPRQQGAFVANESRNIFFPPKFLERTNGSTMFACMQSAGQGLTYEQFFEMATSVDYLVVFVGSDLAGSCGRAKQEILHRCKVHNRNPPLANVWRLIT